MEAVNPKRFSDLVDVDIDQTSNIQEIKKNFTQIKNKLEIIKDVEANDKLACDPNGVYYLDKYDFFQLFKRKFYRQSRVKTSEDLKRDFGTLMKIFDMYLEHIISYDKGLFVIILDEQKCLTKEMVLFIVQIVKGLYNLKQTYPKTEDIVCRIDSIILTLCECKERLEESNKQQLNVNNCRVRAFSD